MWFINPVKEKINFDQRFYLEILIFYIDEAIYIFRQHKKK